MTYIIAEPCIDIKDKSCVDVCPVDCIHEFERVLIIDPEECIDCGACEPECPVEAIFPEDALPEKWEPFVKINYAYGDADTINRLRESETPGGMAHACELETSVYLYLDAERVQMDKARKEIGQPPSDFIWNDLTDPGPIRMMDYWTCFSKSGVNGDPTLATPEKGKIIFQAVVENFVRFAREFKNRPRGERVDYHK